MRSSATKKSVSTQLFTVDIANRETLWYAYWNGENSAAPKQRTTRFRSRWIQFSVIIDCNCEQSTRSYRTQHGVLSRCNGTKGRDYTYLQWPTSDGLNWAWALSWLLKQAAYIRHEFDCFPLKTLLRPVNLATIQRSTQTTNINSGSQHFWIVFVILCQHIHKNSTLNSLCTDHLHDFVHDVVVRWFVGFLLLSRMIFHKIWNYSTNFMKKSELFVIDVSNVILIVENIVSIFE